MDRDHLKEEFRRHAVRVVEKASGEMPRSLRRFGDVEKALKEAAEELEREWLQSWCEEAEDDSATPFCVHCGGKMRQKEQVGKQILCRGGSVTVKRKRWWCEKCGASFFPCLAEPDGQAGPGGDGGGLPISPEAGRSAVEEAGDRPYEQEMRHLRRHHGIRISKDFLEKLTRTVGQFWLERDDQLTERSLTGTIMPVAEMDCDCCCVFADGTMVHTDGEWHEVRVGTVCSSVGEVARKSSIARFADVQRFGADLWRKPANTGTSKLP